MLFRSADGLLAEEYHKGDVIEVGVAKDELQLRVTQEDAKSVSAHVAA